VDPEYQGLGLGVRSLVPLLAEAGRALLPAPIAETVAVAVPVLQQFGTVDQRSSWLPAIGSGECTFAIAAFDSGSDLTAGALPVAAEAIDGGLRLSGTCGFVPYGDRATTILVIARAGQSRTAACLVDAEHTGLVIESVRGLDETTPVTIAHFDDAIIGHGSILNDDGSALLALVVERMWLALAMMMHGAATRIVETAIEHAQTRTQFGNPIGMYQAVKHRIVDMWTANEHLLSLVAYASHATDLGAVDADRVVWSARTYGASELLRIASENIQLHGAMGFTSEMDCHLYLKRAWTWANYWATPATCRSRLAVGLDDPRVLARL
jgi:hypothetical protein